MARSSSGILPKELSHTGNNQALRERGIFTEAHCVKGDGAPVAEILDRTGGVRWGQPEGTSSGVSPSRIATPWPTIRTQSASAGISGGTGTGRRVR